MINILNDTQHKILENTKDFAREKLQGEGTGHDWWHVIRVLNNAQLINSKEDANQLTVELAVLLHDVGDRKVLGTEEDDYSIAESFLETQNLDKATTDHIMHIIKNMSYSKSLNNKTPSETIEFKVVQDADRLDAIGAIGIARAFAYGGSKSRLLYDPTKQAKTAQSTEEYRKSESSTFHHFEEKLLHLKDLMNTDTGRRIAENRHQYMELYLEQFLGEWDGKR